MIKVAVVYHSLYGHTKLQAEAVLQGAQSVPDVSAVLYTAEEATAKLDELDQADAIIFGCPTYMGSMSAGVKTFVETAARSGSRLTLMYTRTRNGTFRVTQPETNQ